MQYYKINVESSNLKFNSSQFDLESAVNVGRMIFFTIFSSCSTRLRTACAKEHCRSWHLLLLMPPACRHDDVPRSALLSRWHSMSSKRWKTAQWVWRSHWSRFLSGLSRCFVRTWRSQCFSYESIRFTSCLTVSKFVFSKHMMFSDCEHLKYTDILYEFDRIHLINNKNQPVISKKIDLHARVVCPQTQKSIHVGPISITNTIQE